MTDKSDVLERARKHLQQARGTCMDWQLNLSLREKQSTNIMDDMVKELEWEHGRPHGKLTQHWLRAAFDRVAAGEAEETILKDFGYKLTTTR